LRSQKVADGKAPPRKKPDDGDGGWLRPKEVGLFKHMDPQQVMREAQTPRLAGACLLDGSSRATPDLGKPLNEPDRDHDERTPGPRFSRVP
jgi:hypothetical protein